MALLLHPPAFDKYPLSSAVSARGTVRMLGASSAVPQLAARISAALGERDIRSTQVIAYREIDLEPDSQIDLITRVHSRHGLHLGSIRPSA